MADSMLSEWNGLRLSWTRAVTSLLWGNWLVLDAGFRATEAILATTAPAASAIAVGEPCGLIAFALARAKKGLAPPREIYLAPYRDRINWADFPEWARPCDPDLFEGCSHEG